MGGAAGTCALPKQFCAGSCVDTGNDPKNCGTCGHDCTALPGINAALVHCAGGTCDVTGACAIGRAHCSADADAGCETDTTKPADCGACGNGCVDPEPLCTMGPSGTYACASGCSAPTSSHCGAACVDTNTDPNHCGDCTTVCPPVIGGGATCSAGSCGFSCNAGRHACGATCVSDTDPQTCGSSCAPCPVVVNANATCDGTTCGFACDAGFHACGLSCASDGDVASCGSSCSPCPVPPNGTATCDGTNCGVACSSGFHLCGTACADDSSVATCGSSCAPCVAPPHAVATCDGASCGYACDAGFADCDGDPSNGCETQATGAGNSVLFCDGFESGFKSWSASGYWTLSGLAFSGTYSAEGTAGSSFPGSCDKSGTVQMTVDVDLSKVTSATLIYESWIAAGANDIALVLASTNGGASWSMLPSPSWGAFWQQQTVDLSAYVGQPKVRIEFQFTNICGDCCGIDWYVDAIRIEGK